MKNFVLKRGVTFILAVILVAGLIPVTPRAAAETMAADVCPCCGKVWSSIKWTEYSKWTNSIGGWFGGGVDFSKAGHYRITDSFTMKKEFSVAANVTIDFNGLLLKAKSGSRGFTVKDGGNLTLINTGGENGRLAGQNTSSTGGAVLVEEGGTLNILSGRVVGVTTTYGGGAIYNSGTVNLAGGSVEGGVLSGGADGGNIYNAGTLNIYGGSVEAGVISGDNGYGGNIYSAGTLNLYGGTVTGGTSQDHGGNLMMAAGAVTNIYAGTVAEGIVTGGDGFSGHGGNIYVSGAATRLNIYGGTITGGQSTCTTGYGGNIMLASGVQVYMYGGTVENGTATAKGADVHVSGSATLDDSTVQYSAFYIMGGTVTGTTDADLNTAANNIILIYNCRYNGSQDITGYLAECTCYKQDDTGITVWNSGYVHGTCTDCLLS